MNRSTRKSAGEVIGKRAKAPNSHYQKPNRTPARIRLAPMTRKAWQALPAAVRYFLPWADARRVAYIEPHELAKHEQSIQAYRARERGCQH